FDIDPETGRHRRFFDIDHLAGVRQEDPDVFAETHKLALSLVREGIIDGLRIDHPDGLADPAGYLRRLRSEGVEHAWVEKILDRELKDGARRLLLKFGDLARALSSLPVYRTYVEPHEHVVADEDREAIAEAGIPEPLARILTLAEPAPPGFVTRFQQTTPPVM